jgi:hypothetical protein
MKALGAVIVQVGADGAMTAKPVADLSETATGIEVADPNADPDADAAVVADEAADPVTPLLCDDCTTALSTDPAAPVRLRALADSLES